MIPEWFVLIPWYNNYYINSKGEVFSVKSDRVLIPQINKKRWWYNYISLQEYWIKPKNWLVHRLVMLTFTWIKEWVEINHIDGNKSNNSLSNLEWVTSSENKIHARNNWLYFDKKSVLQILNWEIIWEFDSITSAWNALNIDISSICMCCNWRLYLWKYTRKTAWWFEWKYK